MNRPSKIRLATVAAAAVAIVTALPAGAVGALTWHGCVADSVSNPDGCSKGLAGLSGVTQVVVSPDGTSAYAVGSGDAVAILSRSSTGALTPVDCVAEKNAGPAACSKTSKGITDGKDIAVSPDSKFVYVIGSTADIAIFKRDRSTGLLQPLGCIADPSSNPDGCANTADGLYGAVALAISPDGTSLYVSGSAELVRFDRDLTTGGLTRHGCVGELNDGQAICASYYRGIASATSVAVSPDGKSVYTAGGQETMDTLKRSKSGYLTAIACLGSATSNSDNCPVTSKLVNEPIAVVVSPDSKFVYLLGNGQIARFGRDTTSGMLTGKGCISNVSGPCSQQVSYFGQLVAEAVSSDGRSLYVVAQAPFALHRFDRSRSTGALTSRGCFNDTDAGVLCDNQAQGLDLPNDVAVSSDGKSVYVAATNADALTRFDRATT